jgi:ABC-type multidrug transport system fused ATPase/permease subunit
VSESLERPPHHMLIPVIPCRKAGFLRATNLSITFVSPSMTAFFTFMTYQLAESNLTADVVFGSLALFSIMRAGISFFLPAAMQSGAELSVGLARLEKFLALHEINSSISTAGRDSSSVPAHRAANPERPNHARYRGSSLVLEGLLSAEESKMMRSRRMTIVDAQGAKYTDDHSPTAGSAPGSPIAMFRKADTGPAESSPQPFIELHRVGLSWVVPDEETAQVPDSSLLLKDLSFRVNAGSLTAVVGPVGVGKSTLLMCALGELRPVQGSITRIGNVAFVAQEPWILSGTIQDNILFGRPFDSSRFHKIVDACCLTADFAQFSDREHTLIGERGVQVARTCVHHHVFHGV